MSRLEGLGVLLLVSLVSVKELCGGTQTSLWLQQTVMGKISSSHLIQGCLPSLNGFPRHLALSQWWLGAKIYLEDIWKAWYEERKEYLCFFHNPRKNNTQYLKVCDNLFVLFVQNDAPLFETMGSGLWDHKGLCSSNLTSIILKH